MSEEGLCRGCRSSLCCPYVRCVTCPAIICLQCFSRGYESGDHASYHPYTIVKTDFVLFEKSWTADEELKLLGALQDSGIDNWVDIANQVETKNKHQCEKHYKKCYINKPHPELPVFPDVDIHLHPAPVVYKESVDPPRPLPSSRLHSEMAGYQPASSDFSQEHNNHAELILADMDFFEQCGDLEKDLNLAVIDIYENTLKERQRRKRLIRKYGLIHLGKNKDCQRRFRRRLQSLVENLRPFMSLFPPEEHQKYLESLYYEEELRSDIVALQDFRSVGVTRIESASVYYQLKCRREYEKSQRTALCDVMDHIIQDESACQQWLHRVVTEGSDICIRNNLPLNRKNAPPLEIAGLPCYEKLSNKEREVCASVRLVPMAFLEFKDLLVKECRKQGYLRLQQARPLIKIDVNKTRKIFDFLVQQGLINKEPLTAEDKYLS